MLNRRAFVGSLAALTLAAPARASLGAAMNVVATTGMIADATSRIGGDAVSVTGLMGPGVDPHSYRQTRSDIVAMTRADLSLWHGLYLEAQMEEFLEELGQRKPVVAVTDTLDKSALLGSDEYEARFDPHVWMNPDLWATVATRIASALTERQPDSADIFAENLATFLAELQALQAYSQDVLATVPEQSRVLLTAHDAFGYFGQAYGYEVLGVQGISTESEAGLQRIRELVDTLVDRDLKAVFVETSVSDRNMRALIEGAASRGHDVALGGELFSDAMGPVGTYEGTYVGMIDHNVTTIARSLGGTAPERGISGKLGHGS